MTVPDRPSVRAEVTLSGVPAWLLAAYLEELGGIQDEAGGVRGEGWTAALAPRRRGSVG